MNTVIYLSIERISVHYK